MPQDAQRVRELVGLEPAVSLPLDPGEAVDVGPDQAPLGPVREYPQGKLTPTQVLDDPRDRAPAPSHSDARHFGGEQGQPLARGSRPQSARLEDGPVQQTLGVGRPERASLAPACVQSAIGLQHGVEQGGQRLSAGLVGVERYESPTQLVGQAVGRIGWVR